MSTRTVYKYDVKLEDEFVLELPRGAHPLTVQMQHGAPHLWALVDPAEPLEKRRFRLVGTGHPIESGDWVRYIDTFQMYEGDLVFHLFERCKRG